MDVRIRRRGPAGKYEMWARCRDPERWPSWLALVRGVEADGLLRPGLEGHLRLVGGFRASFDVIDVDERGTTWTRLVRVGSFRLRIEQRVDEGFARIAVSGAWPVALAYVPFARRSLSRLLRRGGWRRERGEGPKALSEIRAVGEARRRPGRASRRPP